MGYPNLKIGFAPVNFSAPGSLKMEFEADLGQGLSKWIRFPLVMLTDALNAAKRAFAYILWGSSDEELFVNVTRSYAVRGEIRRITGILRKQKPAVTGDCPVPTGMGSGFHERAAQEEVL